jgi:Flp pilus assembly protein TadB
MDNPQPDSSAPASPPLSPRILLKREWPYLLVLVLALFGIAFTSFFRSPITLYWIVLAPLIGVICVATRWRDVHGRDERIRLVWTQALHWAAVLVAMRLVFVADVASMMNADASALAVLTLLALGTFTAGVHIEAWRICLVGVILGIGVPGIAWLEQSALFLLLVALVLVAIIAPFFWRERRRREANVAGAAGSSST